MKIKIITLCLIPLFTCMFSFANVYAQETGTCGDGVTWTYENGILKIEGNGKMKDFDNPSSVPWYEFKDQIVSVIIENDVDSIGSAAFFDCNNLGSVIIGNDVTSIGSSAFLDCDKLTSVRIGSKVKTIGQAAFKMCPSLESIILPQGLESIGHEAFFLCQGLKSITIPSTVTYIGESVFAYCTSLLQVNINANLTKLPDWTFYDCDSLVNVSLPETLTEVGSDAFHGCENLDSIGGNVSSDVNEVINSQINNTVNNEENDDSTVLLPNQPDNLQQDVVENEDIIIGGSITGNEISINATVNNKKGWETVIDKVNEYQAVQDTMEYEEPIKVNVIVKDGLKVSGDLLDSLAGTNTLLILKGDNIEIQINCKDLVIGQKYKDFKLDYTLEKVTKYTTAVKEAIGEATGYYLKLNTNIDFNITVKLYLGVDYKYRIAAVYEKEGDYQLVQSSTIDSEGYVCFYFGNCDRFTKYLIGIDVEGVQTGIVPEDDYNGLVDAYGNRYVITGRTSKWGISAGQVTVLLIAFMVIVAGTIGGVMYMIHRRRIAKEKIRREVMGDLDDRTH